MVLGRALRLKKRRTSHFLPCWKVNLIPIWVGIRVRVTLRVRVRVRVRVRMRVRVRVRTCVKEGATERGLTSGVGACLET